MQTPSSFPRRWRRIAFACGVVLALPLAAQQPGGVTFHHFKRYPTGQWTEVLSGTRDGVSMGPPTTQTVCSGATDAATRDALMKMANSGASGCRTTVLTDTERVAAYDQVCPLGGSTQTMHITLNAVDDRTMTLDTRMTVPGQPVTVLHAVTTYGGPCTPQAEAANRPSAEDCATLKESLADPEAASDLCAQVPAASRGACQARLAAGRAAANALAARCR